MEELLASDFERFLAAVVSKAYVELAQEARDLAHERAFGLSFFGVLGDVDEVQDVRVLGDRERGVASTSPSAAA